jgi:exosortase N
MKALIAYKPHLILCTLIWVCAILLKDYFVLSLPTILILVTLPFVFAIEKPGDFSYRYLFPALLFFIGFLQLGGNMFLYWSLVGLLLFSIEWMYGKTNFLIFILFMLLSPALFCLVRIFTFPVRLTLSTWASNFLNWMGCNVTNKGSYFVMENGFSFSVDQACVGLNMVITGLCLAIVCILLLSKQKKVHLPFIWVMLILLLVFGLLILTNLLRIVALVFFKSMPGTFLHEAIGIVALIVFTIVPTYLLIQKITTRFGKKQIPLEFESRPVCTWLKAMVLLTLQVVFLCMGLTYLNKNGLIIRDEKVQALQIKGFEKSMNTLGVAEFKNNELLIYIKPGVKGWEGDHPPQVCWQASGFELIDFSIKKIDDTSIMWGTLKKDDKIQYTAWWYDNGTIKTIDQLKWRFACGEPFRIINITSSSRTKLQQHCRQFLQKRLF